VIIMRKTILFVFLVMGVLAFSGCQSQKLIGGDKDAHGCLIAAGYSWCEDKQKCIRVWEENCTTSCACPAGYRQEGEVCNPECYYSTPKCLSPSIKCSSQDNTGIANPASVNCENLGGTLEIVTDADGSQTGMCTLPSGAECEEWALFRGECPK
jgi:putative hemolysin